MRSLIVAIDELGLEERMEQREPSKLAWDVRVVTDEDKVKSWWWLTKS